LSPSRFSTSVSVVVRLQRLATYRRTNSADVFTFEIVLGRGNLDRGKVHFVMRVVYLVIFAFLVGYVSESEKRRAAEALRISQVCSRVRVDTGLKSTVQNVMQEILHLFGGRELLIITREAEANRVVLWRAEDLDAGNVVFTWRQLDEADLAIPRIPGMEVLRELARQELPLGTILLTAAIQPFAVTSGPRRLSCCWKAFGPFAQASIGLEVNRCRNGDVLANLPASSD
jgi:hypothetical protein